MALASAQQGWRWGFHSCNGLSAGADVTKWEHPHLWEDVMAVRLNRRQSSSSCCLHVYVK